MEPGGSIDRRLGIAASELLAMGDLAELRHGVLPLLRELIPADMASYNEISRDPLDAFVIGEPHGSLGRVTPARRQRFAELVWQNPLAAHFATTGDPSALRMSDFIGLRALRRLELYDLFYRETGTEYQIAFTVPSEGRLIGVTLSRRQPHDFSAEDRDLLEKVRRLFAPLHRSLFDRDRLHAVLGALDDGDDDAVAPLAVLLVHSSGALEAAHGHAERLLRAIAAERAPLERLHDWICTQRLRRGAASPVAPLVITLRTRELLARYVHGRPGALDAIALHASPRPTLDVLGALGLTPRQASVLQLLWEGASNAEIALALSLSEHTVRHHLEEIYRRLGVRSRAAAANVAGQALRAG